MKPPRGFTLVEVSIAALIFIGIVGALLVSLLAGRRSQVVADAYIQVQEEARRAIDEMIKELRESKSDHMYLVGTNTVVFEVPNDNNNDGTVTTNGVLEWGAPSAASGCVKYTLTGTDIQRSLLAGPLNVAGASCGTAVANSIRVLGTHVSALTFTTTTSGIKIAVTTQQTTQVPGAGESATITGRAQFRNL